MRQRDNLRGTALERGKVLDYYVASILAYNHDHNTYVHLYNV